MLLSHQFDLGVKRSLKKKVKTMDFNKAIVDIHSYIDNKLILLRQQKAELKYKKKITIRIDGRIQALLDIQFFIKTRNWSNLTAFDSEHTKECYKKAERDYGNDNDISSRTFNI